jgi:hypothetical protein
MDQPKIGSGALDAFFRQGLKELAQIVPAFPESVRVVEEPGALGNPTPVEVYHNKMQDTVPQAEPDKAIEYELGQ